MKKLVDIDIKNEYNASEGECYVNAFWNENKEILLFTDKRLVVLDKNTMETIRWVPY